MTFQDLADAFKPESSDLEIEIDSKEVYCLYKSIGIPLPRSLQPDMHIYPGQAT